MNHKYEPRIHVFRAIPSEDSLIFSYGIEQITLHLITTANKVAIKNSDKIIHDENLDILN